MSPSVATVYRVLTIALLVTATSGRLSAQAITVAVESDHVLDLAFSPDGRFIAGGGLEKKIRIWDAKSGALVRSLGGEAGPTKITRTVAFSFDSKLVTAGGDDGIARVWDIATGKLILAWVGHQEMITSVAFSPDGKHLGVGSATMENQGASHRGQIKLWELVPGRPGRTFKVGQEHYPGLAFSPDGKRLAVAEGPVNLWDVASGELNRVLTTEHGKVLRVAFSGDGKTLAGGGGQWVAKGGGTQQISEAWLWDAETGKLRRSFSDLNTWLRSIALSADGRRFATGCTGKEKTDGKGLFWVPSELKLWDTASGKELWVHHGAPGSVKSIAFSPDGNSVVSCDDDGVRLISTKSGEVTRVLMRIRVRWPGN
jgi:WD40 repeat protein